MRRLLTHRTEPLLITEGRLFSFGLPGDSPHRRDVALGDWFGKGRLVRRARELELAHDHAGAVQLYVRAERLDEAARVKLTVAEAGQDPSRRLVDYAQAIDLAPKGGELHRTARAKRATFALALHGGGALAGAARLEIERAAAELLEVGEAKSAARAYRLLGDRDGEARALEAAGEVDELEQLFVEDDLQRKSLQARERQLGEIQSLGQCGRRREALARLTSLLRDAPGDPRYGELAAGLRTRRIPGPAVELGVGSEAVRLVFGQDIVLGRSDAPLVVAHAAVSRRHLGFRRADDGVVWVRDLESRNGTQRGGLPLAGELPLTGPLALTLGREVPVQLTLGTSLVAPEGHGPFVHVQVAGIRAALVLGDRAELPGGWVLALQQEWLELHTTDAAPAYLDDLQLGSPTTLLAGDRLTRARGGEPALVVRHEHGPDQGPQRPAHDR